MILYLSIKFILICITNFGCILKVKLILLNLQELSPTTDANRVKSLMNLLDCVFDNFSWVEGMNNRQMLIFIEVRLVIKIQYPIINSTILKICIKFMSKCKWYIFMNFFFFYVKCCFLFATIWSVCATTNEETRSELDYIFRQLLTVSCY